MVQQLNYLKETPSQTAGPYVHIGLAPGAAGFDIYREELGYLAAVWYVIFILSVTFHEAAHAWAALRGGDPTAYLGGQVTLDPLPHIRRDPIGTVVVPFISFFLMGWMIGWASAPYDPRWAYQYPRRAAWMALAGPLANLAFLLVACALILVGIQAGVFQGPSTIVIDSVVEAVDQNSVWANAATMVSILFSLNLILFLFNLLPVPPMDGSSVVTLFMKEDTARWFQEKIRDPIFSLIGILLAFNLFGYVLRPVFFWAQALLVS